MSSRTEFLQYARRIHDALRRAISDGDGKTDDEWLNVEKPRFAHNVCGMYLVSTLAYLEGLYGTRSWDSSGASGTDFNTFIQNHPRDNLRTARLSVDFADALVLVRHAVVHTECDLSRNHDPRALQKVQAAAPAGLALNGSIVTLVSDDDVDFMSQVRLLLVAVAQFHGDG